jgi:hypothetical protein
MLAVGLNKKWPVGCDTSHTVALALVAAELTRQVAAEWNQPSLSFALTYGQYLLFKIDLISPQP